MRPAVALLVGSVAGLLAASQPVADTDLFWHLATGRETLAGGFVRVDLFSWTVRGEPVSLDQWLGQVLLYGSYLAGGWKGVAVLRVLAVATILALVAANALARTRRPLAAVLAAVPALLLTRAVAVDRPELLGFALFAALLPLLRAGRSGDARALALAVALVAVWANVHGSFALGAVLVVLVSVEGALLDAPRRRAYAVAAVGAVAATLATPSGLGTWTAPGLHLLAPPRDIEEWGLIDVSTPFGLAYFVTFALVLASALRRPRLPPRDLVVLLPVAALSLTAVRQAPLLAIAAAPLLAASAERAIDWLVARAHARRVARGLPERASAPSRPVRLAGRDERAGVASGEREEARRGAVPTALAVLPPLALFALALAIAPAAADERAFPTGALPALPKGDGLLARYEWGGWLIWRAPGTPVFVDGRLVPYRGEILDDYRRIVTAAPGWQEAVARRGVRALLVAPTDPVAVRARELGWNEIATGPAFVLVAVP